METEEAEQRTRQEEQMRKQYEHMFKDFEKEFEEYVNSIGCTSCNGRHKRILVKERDCFAARYCAECKTMHSANDGDVWAECSVFGIGWKCFACLDGEVSNHIGNI